MFLVAELMAELVASSLTLHERGFDLYLFNERYIVDAFV